MIGGTLITHNCIERDYCFREALLSLMPFCDQIEICDAESTDGTYEVLLDESKKHPGCHVFQLPWRPHGKGDWLRDLTNACRERLTTEYHFSIQADEVAHEDDTDEIRSISEDPGKVSAWMNRLNFWGDTKHLAPEGTWCGTRIIRLAPAYRPLIGDAETIEDKYSSNVNSNIRLFHYGSIRKPEGWIKKTREMQGAYWSTCDPIVNDVARDGMIALVTSKELSARSMDKLIPYNGTHPAVAYGWMKERGYSV